MKKPSNAEPQCIFPDALCRCCQKSCPMDCAHWIRRWIGFACFVSSAFKKMVRFAGQVFTTPSCSRMRVWRIRMSTRCCQMNRLHCVQSIKPWCRWSKSYIACIKPWQVFAQLVVLLSLNLPRREFCLMIKRRSARLCQWCEMTRTSW